MLKLVLASTLVALSSVLATSTNVPTKLHVLVYETDNDALGADSPSQRLVDQINGDSIEGMHATVYGHKNRVGFAGYGSKFSAVVPILELISQSDDDSLVILSDSRDVLVNNPFNDKTYSKELVSEFRVAFDEATSFKPKSIVISAEAQCCVSALTHVPLGGYYNADGSRNNVACSSGSEGCLWAGDDKAEPWERFMNERMLEQSIGNKYDDAYLNAGLIVGKPKDLLRVILSAQINDNEDDQAVWTDYMYHNPNDIVLDYQQRLFGNNRGGVASIHDGGCVFHKQVDSKRLVHMMTHTQPLFLHSPGAFFMCHDQMSQALGVPKVGATIRRKLRTNDKSRRTQCNYGRLGTDCADNDNDGGGFFGDLFDFFGGTSSNSSDAVPTAAPVSSLGSLLDRTNASAVPSSALSNIRNNSTSTNSSLLFTVPGLFTNASNTTGSLLMTNTSNTTTGLTSVLTSLSTSNSTLTNSSLTSLGSVMTNQTVLNPRAPVSTTVSTPVAAPSVFSFFNVPPGQATTTTTTTSSVDQTSASVGSATGGTTSLDSYLKTATVAPVASLLSSIARTPAPAPIGTLEGVSRVDGSKPAGEK